METWTYDVHAENGGAAPDAGRDGRGTSTTMQRARFLSDPHPPRSTFQVDGLPHGIVELTAVLHAPR